MGQVDSASIIVNSSMVVILTKREILKNDRIS